MKRVKHIEVNKQEIQKKTILKRKITKTHLKYVGECKIGIKMFTGELELDISTYHQNKDDLQYIDNFAKQEIVKEIIIKINRK